MMDNPLQIAKEIIEEKIRLLNDGSMELRNGCVVCHTIFTLSQVLTNNESLNEAFISSVEDIHMRSRMLGTHFCDRTREDKDRYLESYCRNALSELQSDVKGHGAELALRKLVLNYLSVYLAQTLGVDHHAAMEEMYYLLRKNQNLDSFLDGFVVRLMKDFGKQ
jgi:hypothetical protein